MSDRSAIEWTDATWNPVTGCTKVSPGCDHCYAETFAERWRGVPGHHFERGFDPLIRPARLLQPLKWRGPRRVFVNSMSDLFHAEVPGAFIARVFAVMLAAQQHTFQLLTKRHARMRDLLSRPAFRDLVFELAVTDYGLAPARDERRWWPLPNVWLGVSAEKQKWAGIRLPALLDTPAAVRFVSAEPLLGPIDLLPWLKRPQVPACDRCDPGGPLDWQSPHLWGRCRCDCHPARPGIDWVISGGESGPGARPAHPDWFRTLRDQCGAAGVAYFHKQHGAYTWQPSGPQRAPDLFVCAQTGQTVPTDHTPATGTWAGVWRVGKKAAGRVLDGRTWNAMPTPHDGTAA
ncbi:DUF5131 family protein [Actinomadura montaniterrae]|uniref:Phage Gp37/Gp68 family protein n=1 Tax=Actinomadura montaniterrae TaxID=1803903 RepID=A0A6L3VSJ9_9ACTN|nr:phage Gp37/Gp68 family protein [Actinomadura montaniterrae]KAB2371121.1 phage Gp37/Gp68 family protein [Actinomadura montaniterrae]